MTSELFDEIVAALQSPRVLVRQAASKIPDTPGMYALYGTVESVRELGIPSRDPELPLFVGKADRSSLRVELRDHFTTGKTPWSTVRRSIAALLRDQLKLGVEPYHGDPLDGRLFGLEPASDERLTGWMGANLKLALWIKPRGVALRGVDKEVVAAFRPPLVLRGVGRPWLRLQALRAAMAQEARRLQGHGAGVAVPRSRYRATGWAPAAGRASNQVGAVQSRW